MMGFIMGIRSRTFGFAAQLALPLLVASALVPQPAWAAPAVTTAPQAEMDAGKAVTAQAPEAVETVEPSGEATASSATTPSAETSSASTDEVKADPTADDSSTTTDDAAANDATDGDNAGETTDDEKKDDAAANNDAAAELPTLSYQAHVQNVGWQAAVADGQTAGTQGRALRVEAFRVSLSCPEGTTGSVRYRAHVENIGWQPWVSSNDASAFAGTTGRSLRVEAFEAELAGDVAAKYDLYYRAYVQNIGWLAWTKNGSPAGTSGLCGRLESLEFHLAPKDGQAPAATGFSQPYVAADVLTYQGHVQNLGWLGQASQGALCGTSGRALRLEAFKMGITRPQNGMAGGVSYRAHVSGIGWQPWVQDGAVAGTEHQSRQIEAISIKLTGDLSRYFDVWYRAHVESYGWLGWAKDGQDAGSTGIALRLEGFEAKLVFKGTPAPGANANYYTNKAPVRIVEDAAQRAMTAVAQTRKSATNWLILVNNSTCHVGVYRRSGNRWVLDRYRVCSPGKPSTPTVRGEYRIGSRGYSFGHGYTCYYWTQFYGNYLFHSVLYYQNTRRIMDGRLGQQLSHGCVRMNIDDAKWIHDVIPTGTKVYSY